MFRDNFLKLFTIPLLLISFITFAIPNRTFSKQKANNVKTKLSCKKGHIIKKNKCVKIKVPNNGKLDATGNGWVCNLGYKKNKDKCREMTKKELIQKIKTERGQRSKVIRYLTEDPCDRGLNECSDECSNNLYNYVSGNYINTYGSNFENNCKEACEEGKSACENVGKYERCGTFDSACSMSCPTSVYVYKTSSYLYSTNAHTICTNACSSGQSSCN